MDVQNLKNPDSLESISDLTRLLYLNESAVLETLRARFIKKFVYTQCGIILFAVNPFEELPIYGQDAIDLYRRGDPSLDPHIFAVAQEAFSRLERDNGDQSIVMSGESGAGKTMSAKYVMRYLASVDGSSAETEVENKVLASSPIMEAFGNATTLRNDNSSRFGKFMQINFNAAHTIVGAKIRTYLLEKSRVVCQGSGERNYHIFHQLCAAAGSPEFSDLKLGPADSFCYTRQGQNADDDLDKFQETRKALFELGFSEEEQLQMFRILSAVLNLGNVEIKETDEGDSMIPQEESALNIAMDLLGLDDDYRNQFLKWLIQRKMVVGNDVMFPRRNVEQAKSCRDALAKNIYAYLFKWIVVKLNETLASSKETQRFIGILDIYGFEEFKVNSLEQLCINYANEKLLYQFNDIVFHRQQKEYKGEGIQWEHIDFKNNNECIDLIEGKAGILKLLDDQSKLGRGNDESWLDDMCRKLKENSQFKKSKTSNSEFVIGHYAGDVNYKITGFVEKNEDRVDEMQVEVLRSSKNPLLVKLVEGHSTSKKTVAFQFKESLNQLMTTLGNTCVHYVRCLKPNDDQIASTFVMQKVEKQLKACGIVETIKICTAGYHSRMTYENFVRRYHWLAEKTLRELPPHDACLEILRKKLHAGEKYELGQTKIFFHREQIVALENDRKYVLTQKIRPICEEIRKLARIREEMKSKEENQSVGQSLEAKKEIFEERSEEQEEYSASKLENEDQGSVPGSEISGDLEDDSGYVSRAPSVGKVESSDHHHEAGGIGSAEPIERGPAARKVVTQLIDNDLPGWIVAEFSPEMAKINQPGAPVYFIYMTMRYRDSKNDKEGTNKILTDFMSAVTNVLREKANQLDYWVLWFANVHCMLNYLETSKKNDQYLRNFDSSTLKEQATSIYHGLFELVKNSISWQIWPAVIDFDPTGTSVASPAIAPPSLNGEPLDPKMSFELLIRQLGDVLSLSKQFGVDQPLLTQLFRQICYYISAMAVNGLLLRKEKCTLSNGMNITFNVKSLERWIKSNVVQDGHGLASILDTLAPLTQASLLLIGRKEATKASLVIGSMDKLNSLQILRLLNSYTCDLIDEPVAPDFITETKAILEQREKFKPSALLMDTRKML